MAAERKRQPTAEAPAPPEAAEAEGGAAPAPGELTIDQLAERVGMSVRNLREWRTLGLLPRARMRGRVGYYDEAVVTRLERVKKLHAEGFTLELIQRMLDAGGAVGDEVVRLAETLRSPLREPADGTAHGAADPSLVWGSEDPADLERGLELGMLRRTEDGAVEFASPRIAEIGAALRALGLSPTQILDSTGTIRAHADGIAELFEGVWREHIWEPFVDAGLPEEQLPAIQEAAMQVRPLALDAVIEIFTIAMEARIASGIAAELERGDADAGG